MHQTSIATSIFLSLVRVLVFAALAYGTGYLVGYFTNLPVALVGGVIGATFFLYMLWCDKRSAVQVGR